MAYLIFNHRNNLVKIAANDSDRDSQNIVLSNHSVVNVSDDDFLRVKTNVVEVSYDGTNVTYTDVTDNYFSDENVLQSYLNDIKQSISSFLDVNRDHSLHDSLMAYYSDLDHFDMSSISFPMDKTWEQYCNENSITFYHPLQIP